MQAEDCGGVWGIIWTVVVIDVAAMGGGQLVATSLGRQEAGGHRVSGSHSDQGGGRAVLRGDSSSDDFVRKRGGAAPSTMR